MSATETQRPIERWYADKIGWLLLGSGAAAGIAFGAFLLSASSLSVQVKREESESERERPGASDGLRLWPC